MFLKSLSLDARDLSPALTNMMREVEEEEYEQRMKKTKLMSLDMRRLRSDLIDVYKIMHNLEASRVKTSSHCAVLVREVINIPSPSSVVASTAENTFSHKGWPTSGTGYQLQPFVQRLLLTGSKTRYTECYGNTGALCSRHRPCTHDTFPNCS